MKQYQTAIMASQKGGKYLLTLETSKGYPDEFYEFGSREEAIKAYELATYLVKHHYILQSFEAFERMNTMEWMTIKAGCKLLKQTTKFMKWATE